MKAKTSFQHFLTEVDAKLVTKAAGFSTSSKLVGAQASLKQFGDETAARREAAKAYQKTVVAEAGEAGRIVADKEAEKKRKDKAIADAAAKTPDEVLEAKFAQFLRLGHSAPKGKSKGKGKSSGQDKGEGKGGKGAGGKPASKSSAHAGTVKGK